MEKAGKLFAPMQPFWVATELFSPEWQKRAQLRKKLGVDFRF